MKKERIHNFSEIEQNTEQQSDDGDCIFLEEIIHTAQNVFFDSKLSPRFTDGQRLLLKMGLTELTDIQRCILRKIYFDGEADAEIAKEMKITRQAVNQQHNAILKKLRKICLGNFNRGG